MKNLAPEIFRQRLLIEGYYTIEVTRESLAAYLGGVAAHLGLRAYGEAAIFSPGGAGSAANQGFDAFLPLVDSGISAYVWTERQFVSVFLYTCKGFDEGAALAFTRRHFGIAGEIASASV
jgi:S-adenosylmethionine decarboxylase